MDIEELKKQLLANLEEAKRLAAETKEMADAMEAGRLRIAASSLSGATSEQIMVGMEPSLREMRAYIDKVKQDIAEHRKYRNLPWWKRIFKARPAL